MLMLKSGEGATELTSFLTQSTRRNTAQSFLWFLTLSDLCENLSALCVKFFMSL